MSTRRPNPARPFTEKVPVAGRRRPHEALSSRSAPAGPRHSLARRAGCAPGARAAQARRTASRSRHVLDLGEHRRIGGWSRLTVTMTSASPEPGVEVLLHLGDGHASRSSADRDGESIRGHLVDADVMDQASLSMRGPARARGRSAPCWRRGHRPGSSVRSDTTWRRSSSVSSPRSPVDEALLLRCVGSR